MITDLPAMPSTPPDQEQGVPFTATLEQMLEELCDILAEADDLQSICRGALSFILRIAERTSGALIVQSSDDAVPFLITQEYLSEEWRQQLGQPGSALHRFIQDILINNVRDAGQSAPPDDLAATLRLPYRSGQQGVLLLQGAPCTASEMDLLSHFARPIGRAIWTTRFKLSRQHHGKELAILQMIVSALSYTDEFDVVQSQLIQGIRRILGADHSALVLIDEENKKLVTKKSLDQDSVWIYQVNLNVGDGLVQECLRTGRPVCVNDLASDQRYTPEYDSMEGIQARSMLCAPMTLYGQMVGAIQAFNKHQGAFDTYDQDMLMMIAGLASHTIHLTRLIQQLKVANADLEASHWELLRSRNTLRALFDSMPAALYIIDRKYKLVAINMSCAQRTGKMPNILVGRQCYEALYGHKEPCPGCKVSETFFSGQNTNRTERRWGTEEDPTEWEVSTYPILDETDQVVQAILLEQDVTEKRRLEGIIAQSEKLAAVGQLAAGVAHEINNPLTAILANAQLLQRQLPADDEMQESIDLIARAGARATQVVRNLLDFARKENYSLEPTDINETIQRALALVAHELLSRSITLTFEPAKDLPRTLASHDHLEGVWLNLMLNAVDAIDTGPGNIHVTTRRVGNEIRTSIVDNGKGIPPERISRIFEPFYTTKAPGRGTGLGLSVCHRIVKQHGGHILVDSQIGVGTEFTVVLPIS